MTVQTLITIILVSFGVIILASLYVLTFILARKTVKNNPKKAIVLIKNGAEISVEKGTRVETSGMTDKYKYSDKVVFVPLKYNVHYLKNKRLIFVNTTGQLISTPFNQTEKISSIERENLIYEFVESHIGSDGMRAIRGTKKTSSIILIAVVAFIIGAVGAFLFGQFQDTMKNQQDNKTQPTQVPNITQPIEVK